MKENGYKIKCTAMVCSLGLIVKSTKVSMSRTERKDTGNSIGQMENATRDIGKMGNRTARELLQIWKVKRRKGYGKKAKELNG